MRDAIYILVKSFNCSVDILLLRVCSLGGKHEIASNLAYENESCGKSTDSVINLLCK